MTLWHFTSSESMCNSGNFVINIVAGAVVVAVIVRGHHKSSDKPSKTNKNCSGRGVFAKITLDVSNGLLHTHNGLTGEA